MDHDEESMHGPILPEPPLSVNVDPAGQVRV